MSLQGDREVTWASATGRRAGLHDRQPLVPSCPHHSRASIPTCIQQRHSSAQYGGLEVKMPQPGPRGAPVLGGLGWGRPSCTALSLMIECPQAWTSWALSSSARRKEAHPGSIQQCMCCGGRAGGGWRELKRNKACRWASRAEGPSLPNQRGKPTGG